MMRTQVNTSPKSACKLVYTDMENFNQDQFDNWCDLWDQAKKSDAFKKEEGGMWIPPSQKGVDFNQSPQDFYWNNLEGAEQQVLNENKTSNPIYPDSVGKDQDQPKPAWVKEDLLKDIADMKRKLYDLEVKLNKKDGGDGDWVEKCHHPDDSKLWSQIQDLKKKIDEMSNKLGVEDEPSVSKWEVGTDNNSSIKR